MGIRGKTQIVLALIVVCVFLFQNCASLIIRNYQKTPVSSSPFGAKIRVNGKLVGYAPLILKLEKTKSHTIRIEKQGYHPYEIKITRKPRMWLSIIGSPIIGVIGLFIGGFIGAHIAHLLPHLVLRRLFGVLLLCISMYMLLGR